MGTDEGVYVVHVRAPEGEKHYATLLPPEIAFSAGLVHEAIAGQLLHPWEPGIPITPDVFVPNPAFVKVMHEVIARTSPELLSCRTEARRIGDGYLYIIDQRTPTPEDAVPPEDIIGAFEVKGGEVAMGSYWPNPDHRILTARGFFRLDAQLGGRLVQELQSRNRRAS